MERTAPESAVKVCTPVFTARCRPQRDMAHHIQQDRIGRSQRPTTNVNSSADDTSYFQGVTGGTLSVAGGTSTVLKSAGLTISRYSMSGE